MSAAPGPPGLEGTGAENRETSSATLSMSSSRFSCFWVGREPGGTPRSPASMQASAGTITAVYMKIMGSDINPKYFDPPKPKRLRGEGKEGEKGGKRRRKEGRTVLKMGIHAFKRAHKQN